jgi:hypothetical protein
MAAIKTRSITTKTFLDQSRITNLHFVSFTAPRSVVGSCVGKSVVSGVVGVLCVASRLVSCRCLGFVFASVSVSFAILAEALRGLETTRKLSRFSFF